MTERTTVRLPPDLVRQAKRKAATDGQTLTSLIEEGLRLVVAEQPNSARVPRSLSSSKATGGPLPGVLEKFSAVEEMDDLERPASGERHPLLGSLKGLIEVMPGTDLTAPADPEWGETK
jgi:hypothetical protein